MGTSDHNSRGLLSNELASHPGGSSNIPSHFMLQETGVKRQPDGPAGSYADFTYQVCSVVLFLLLKGLVNTVRNVYLIYTLKGTSKATTENILKLKSLRSTKTAFLIHP